MGNMSGSYGSHYTLRQTITINSQNVTNNTSNVTVKMFLDFDGSDYWASQYDTTYGEMQTNRWDDNTFYSLGTFSQSSLEYSAGTAKSILLAQWTDNVNHNTDGTKLFKVKGSWDTSTSRIGSGSCSAQLQLTPIPRYATCTQSLNTKTLNTIKMNWSSDSTIDYIWYSKDNGTNWTAVGSVNATSGNYTITGLSPNTAYNIKTKVRRKDSQLTTISSVLAVTTYNKATISSAPNFNHGATETVTYANPGSATLAIGLFNTAGTTAYAAYRTCTGTSYTFTFTDTELDTLYKLYGNGNTISAKIFIRSTSNSTNYTDGKEVTITLKGNQKTAEVKVSGTWRRAKAFIKVSGTWRNAVIWTKVNGTWRRCI